MTTDLKKPETSGDTDLRTGLQHLLGGISTRVAEVVIGFDQPIEMRPLVTKTLRGLSGHALLDLCPALAKTAFTPRNGSSNAPPAFALSPLFRQTQTEMGLPFQLKTWDADAVFLEAFVMALEAASDEHRPFGETGAKLTGVAVGDISGCRFEGESNPNRPDQPAAAASIILPKCRVELSTPLCLRTRMPAAGFPVKGSKSTAMRRPCERPVLEEEFTFGHLIRAAAIRLNNISRYHGNGAQLYIRDWLARAALVRETGRRLKKETASRYSTRQNRQQKFTGLTGVLEVANAPIELVELLDAVGLFQLGHHTTSGCGTIEVEL